MMRLYLASQSPRRRELLHQMGIAFDTLVFRAGLRSDDQVDESPHAGEPALAYVERVARAKAAHGIDLLLERRLLLHPVLAADTTLEFEGEIIGKPLDGDDAGAILRRLSGRTHRVLTGVAVAHEGRTEYVLSSSEVRFRPISDDEIRITC
jgi:septum formation protein